MSNRVLSDNVIIEMLVSGTYYPVFCGKTMEYSQSQELVEVTSVNSGSAREYESGMTSATLNISGVTVLDNTGNRIAITYLMQVGVRRAAQTMRIRLTDDDGGTLQIAFSALVTNNTLSRSVGTYSQSSVSLTITGEPVISAIIPPPGPSCIEEPLYIDAVAGEYRVHSDLLEADGVIILAVARSGDVHEEVSGTPGNHQFQFVGGAGNGDIYFDSTNVFNDGEVIYVLYRIPV